MAEILALIGGAKFIYDRVGDNAETQKLIRKLERLSDKYSQMDKRTNASQQVRDKLMQAKGAIEARNSGGASILIDGCLAAAGLA